MADLGKLWFSIGLNDETDKDYDKIKKKIEEKLKEKIEVKIRPSVDAEQLKRTMEVAFNKVSSGSFSRGIDLAVKGVDQLNKSAEKLAKALERIKDAGGFGGGARRPRLPDESRNLEKIASALYRIDTLENKIRMNSRLSGNSTMYEKALKDIERLRAAIQSLNATDTGAVNSATGRGLTYQLSAIRLLVQEEERRARIQNRNKSRSLAESTRQAAIEQRNLARFTGEANSKLSSQSRIANEVKNQISGYLSIYAAERFLGSVIQIGGEFEKQKIALRSILGDASKAETIFSQIKTLAVESPFEFKDLASYTKQLSAFSIPYEELYDTTKRLADISAGLGIDMGRIILAYGQVRSAAFLRGQEVRQFTEAGIPLIDELAKKFTQLEGNVVSAGEVFDRISKRMVSFEMVKDVLWDLTNEGGKFYNMQEELAESLAGRWANLRDSYDIMLSEIAEGNNGPLKASLDILTGLMNNWRGVASVIGTLLTIYGTYKAAIISVNTVKSIGLILDTKLNKAAVASRIAILARAAAMNKLTTSGMAAAASLKSLNKVLSIGKVGWIGIAAGIVLSIVGHLINANREANRLKNNLRDVLSDEAVQAQNATDVYKMLVNQLKNATVGSEEYNNILNKIQTRYGSYIGDIKRESDAYEQLRVKINSVSDALRRKAAESARDRGLTSIKESYAEDIKELEDKLVKNLMSNVSTKYTRGVAEGVATSFRVAMEEALNSGKTVLPARVMDKVVRNAGLDEVNIRNVYDYYSKLAKKLEEMHNEEVDFQSTIEKTFGETGKRAGIAMKELDNWRKSVKDFIGDNKNLLLFNPKDDENVDSWVERVLNRYKELVEERKKLQEMSSAGSPLFRSEELKSTEKNLSIITQLVNKFKLLQLPSFNKDLQKENEDDKVAKQWKDRIDLMQDAIKEYEKWEKLVGSSEASERLKESGMFSKLGEGFDFSKTTRELRDFVKYMNIMAKTDEQKVVAISGRKIVYGMNYDQLKETRERFEKEEDAWLDYLSKYGSWEEKRWAIRKKYEKLMSGSETAGEWMKYQEEMKKSISDLSFDEFKASEDWQKTFGNLENLSMATLKRLKAKMEEFKKSSSDLPVDQFKEISEILEKISDRMESMNPFSAAVKGTKDFFKSLSKLKQVRKDLKVGTKTQDDYNDALDASTKSAQNLMSALSGVGDVFSQLGNLFSDFDSKTSKTMNAIADGINTTVSMAQTGMSIGGPAGAAIGAGLGIGITVMKNMKIGADYSGYESMVARYEVLLDIWDELIDKKRDYINESYGKEASQAADEALRLVESQKNVERELAKKLLSSGASAGSHSINYRMWKGSYKWDGKNWRDVAEEISKALGGVKFDGMEDMLYMTGEQLSWIKENYSGLWAAMNSDFREHLEQLIKYGETEVEIAKSLSDRLAGLSFSGFQDDFIDSLSDMDTSFENMCDNFEEYLRKAIISALVSNEYSEEIKKLYDKWTKYAESDNKIDKWEADALRDEYEKLAQDMLDKRNEMAKTFGWGNGGESNSLGKSVQSLTEDTGNLVASYLNATRADVSIIKMHVEKFLNETYPSVNLMAESQLQQLTLIANNTGRNAGLVEEIRDMINIVVDKGGRKIRM